jgi:hypothetical protein
MSRLAKDVGYSKPAQQSRLDGDQKALAGIALLALESAYIIARCGREEATVHGSYLLWIKRQ